MKVLIIGYGSIGRRHANILNSHPKVRDLKVFTSQKNIKYKRISLKSEILKFDPDYFIISNETNLHLNYLKFLENNFKHKDILVEIVGQQGEDKYICYANGCNYIISKDLIKEMLVI